MKLNKAVLVYLENNAGVLDNKQLAKDTGLTVATVQKRVKKILEGRPSVAPVTQPEKSESPKTPNLSGFDTSKGAIQMTPQRAMDDDKARQAGFSKNEWMKAHEDHIHYFKPNPQVLPPQEEKKQEVTE